MAPIHCIPPDFLVRAEWKCETSQHQDWAWILLAPLLMATGAAGRNWEGRCWAWQNSLAERLLVTLLAAG